MNENSSDKKSEEKNGKKSDVVEISVGKYLDKARKNPWIISSVVLALIVIVLLIFGSPGASKGATGNAISEQNIGKDAVNFINTQLLQGQGVVTLINISDKGNFYEVNVDFTGKTIPTYFSKDGKYFLGTQIVSTSEDLASLAAAAAQNSAAAQPKDVPKTDKPKVELFVFSYCPYGLQMEKAFIPVYELLKNKADINIVAIGAMHGEFEKTESLRQVCIEKIYGKDKLWSYLNDFDTSADIGKCNGNDACLSPLLQKIYSLRSIDKLKVDSCMKTDASAIYGEQNAEASSLGVSGSPTLVINGVQVSPARTAEAVKQSICRAFITSPAECSTTLSTESASAGFGSSASTSTSGSAASCGA